jgi:hypothetical protein
MSTSDQILIQLDNFRHKDKFADSEWERRGLIPSDPELCSKMEYLLNQCTDSIIDLVRNNASSHTLKRTLISGLARFNRFDYDTEEREFISDYFTDLSGILSIKINNNLNAFLYGWLMVAFIKIHKIFTNPEKGIDTFSQNCTKCGSNLMTSILKTEVDNPKFGFEIVRCRVCGEYNMIVKGQWVKMAGRQNFDSIEFLSQDEFTLEQAKTRLEQIKLFRK